MRSAAAALGPTSRRAEGYIASGTVVDGTYRVERPLGAGGMAMVYLARDLELGRDLALKVYEVDARELSLSRIYREARAMARLAHPNVLVVHGVGVHEHRVFLAMEYVDGGTLRSWWSEQPRSPAEIVAMFVQCARGLAAAHAVGIVHGDFKPDNVLVGRDGRARVADFGLARVMETAQPAAIGADAALLDVTLSVGQGGFAGTPRYAAPEQFAGGPVDARSDEFSFCVALYEALYGAQPFAGDDFESLAASVEVGRMLPRPSGREVPAWIDRVIVRGLAREPAGRFPSMTELAAALERDPLRRRAWAGGIAVVAVAGAIATGLAVDRGRRSAACRDAATGLAEIWNAGAREQVRAAILGTQKRFATSTWARLEPQLDEYAARWASQREATCRAATVERTQSEDLALRADECLAEASDALASLVAALVGGGQEVVQQALPAAATLPALDVCGDATALLHRPPPMTDPSTHASAAALARELAMNGRFADIGNSNAAIVRAQSLAAAADELAWPPLQARALIGVGVRARESGRIAEAEDALQRATAIALRHGMDDLAVDAITALIHAITSSGGHFERGAYWSWLGTTMLERIQEGVPERRIALWAAIGGLHLNRAEYPEATEAYARALDLGESAFGRGHPINVRLLDGLATSWIERGSFAEAVAVLEPAIGELEVNLGVDHPDVADMRVTLAIAFEREGNYERAIPLYERALAIDEEALGPDDPRVANVSRLLGQAYDDSGDAPKARIALDRCLEITTRVYGKDSVKVADALHARGALRSAMGDVEGARADFERALEIRSAVLPADHPHIGFLLMNIAATYSEAGDCPTALEFYMRAVAALEKQSDDDRVALLYKEIARCRLGTKNPIEASRWAQRAIDVCATLQCPADTRAGLHWMMAMTLWELPERRAEAIAQMQTARRDAIAAPAHQRDERLPEIDAWLAEHG